MLTLSDKRFNLTSFFLVFLTTALPCQSYSSTSKQQLISVYHHVGCEIFEVVDLLHSRPLGSLTEFRKSQNILDNAVQELSQLGAGNDLDVIEKLKTAQRLMTYTPEELEQDKIISDNLTPALRDLAEKIMEMNGPSLSHCEK